jgi:hypothetical protein
MSEDNVTKDVAFGMVDELSPLYWVVVLPKGRLRQIRGRKS